MKNGKNGYNASHTGAMAPRCVVAELSGGRVKKCIGPPSDGSGFGQGVEYHADVVVVDAGEGLGQGRD